MYTFFKYNNQMVIRKNKWDVNKSIVGFPKDTRRSEYQHSYICQILLLK